jgi:hypothetical protein
LCEDAGELAQDLVTCPMPRRVIERFEVVEIEQQQGQGLIRPTRPPRGTLKRLIERAPIGNTRQSICLSHTLQISIALPEFHLVHRHRRQIDQRREIESFSILRLAMSR